MKRKLTATCALLLVAAMTFTACGSKTSNTTKTTISTATSTEADTATTAPTDNGEAPEEISVMVWDRGNAAPNTTSTDNALTKWIQEQVLQACNVKVNFVSVPRSGSDDKLNIMMAGGTAPDIVFTYSQNLYGSYVTSNGLADLTDAYANNGSTIKNNIGDIQYMGQMDGKQYAIMKRRGQQVPRHVSYIRKDWLDKLGMEVPKTKEELFTALRAFKEKNPGNVDNVIPWAMGGTTDTEKFYLNFIGSYVPELSEKDAYIYSENFKIFAPGAVDGLKQMNQLYNEGLITNNFATDTTNDIFKQDMCAGNVGFTLDDATNIFDYIPVLKTNVVDAKFVPLMCFDTPEGSYINPTEPLFGMFIMVPATGSDKVDACMKYLNWQADPAVAENIEFTPDHKVSDEGVPQSLTEDELYAKGYPGTTADLNIVNQHFTYVDNKEAVISSWTATLSWEDKEWFTNLYDVENTNQYVYPTFPAVLESEATYLSNVKVMAIEYVYKLISCDPSKFDSLQKSEYDKILNTGLSKILEERAAYYDANATK
ncbi:extracellular solute-binding protein [Anaerocolumna sedimenticola]|uniref:Extracellular solute-binding protein n=1 Tax=Anaerocolumna sedimenticola TaxID=2696063 RepID=A0A6P1TIF8_9FIRM|nr:extracellular solute-binding protein [Anaerocolumna sedimenticola]QHQ59831.1 extracellular solute-binding protein [Anaerocolumna sedimenticola]